MSLRYPDVENLGRGGESDLMLIRSLSLNSMKREHYVDTDGYLNALRDLMEKKFAKVVSGKL